MQIVSKRNSTVGFVLAVAAAVLSKRRYPKAQLFWLVKRLIGWIFPRVLSIPIPQRIESTGSAKEIAGVLRRLGCKKPLIVTDKDLVKHGLVKPITDSLDAQGVKAQVYDNVVANPPSELVEEGHALYKDQGCDSIVAFGGGSPMDVAKVIGAKVCNPAPNVADYQGFFQVNRMGLRPLPPFIAVPTTAGTGSETTIAAIITLAEKKAKIVVADIGLVPSVAVLDPELLVKLPKGVTAATGMDALTHAIESYIGGWGTSYSKRMSLSAVKKIYNSLTVSYDDGTNLEARMEMLVASHEAGLAFTRANVGYVHAIAHQFGGMFHTPHGVANAILLPHVLAFYLEDEGESSDNLFCTTQFCELAVAAGLAPGFSITASTASEKRALAQRFVASIKDMNHRMNIDTTVKGMMAADVDEVATRALREAHGEQHSLLKRPVANLLDLGMPVPKYMTHEECKKIIQKVLAPKTQ